LTEQVSSCDPNCLRYQGTRRICIEAASVGGLFIYAATVVIAPVLHFWDMPTGRDDVSFRGKTGSRRSMPAAAIMQINQNLGLRKEVETHLVGILKDRFDRNEFHSNELVSTRLESWERNHAHLN
jgi:hypothetical protein